MCWRSTGMIAEAESHAHGVPSRRSTSTRWAPWTRWRMFRRCVCCSISWRRSKLWPRRFAWAADRCAAPTAFCRCPPPPRPICCKVIPAYSGRYQNGAVYAYRCGAAEALCLPVRRNARYHDAGHRLRHGHQGVRRRQLHLCILGRNGGVKYRCIYGKGLTRVSPFRMRDFREKMAGFEFDLISGLGGENHSLTLESSVLYYKRQ